MTSPVLFSLISLQNGEQLGHAQLNLPDSLNALNLEVVRLLTEKLTQWQNDDSIAGVFLSGAGNKAFCAGGDVVSLYNAMKDYSDQGKTNQTPPGVEAFFTEEYQLDYLIHRYSKPFIVWGSGFIMGGGIGLFAGASHRIVTDTSRLAMPEITIGLFPDVGGSYFLNQLNDNMGLFLGLTGVQFNGKDAKTVGMATHTVAGKTAEEFLSALSAMAFSGAFDSALNRRLEELECGSDTALPESNIARHYELISNAMSKPSLTEIVNEVSSWAEMDDKWLSRAAKTLIKGSPITQRLVYEQINRGIGLSLAQCFQMELVMACRCASAGEFQEGVRALLIEKDGAPTWLYDSHQSVPEDFIESFFTNHWDKDSHPLSHLQ